MEEWGRWGGQSWRKKEKAQKGMIREDQKAMDSEVNGLVKAAVVDAGLFSPCATLYSGNSGVDGWVCLANHLLS